MWRKSICDSKMWGYWLRTAVIRLWFLVIRFNRLGSMCAEMAHRDAWWGMYGNYKLKSFLVNAGCERWWLQLLWKQLTQFCPVPVWQKGYFSTPVPARGKNIWLGRSLKRMRGTIHSRRPAFTANTQTKVYWKPQSKICNFQHWPTTYDLEESKGIEIPPKHQLGRDLQVLKTRLLFPYIFSQKLIVHGINNIFE